MARRLTREEALFVGGSAGLITHVALEIARRIDDPNAFVVTFLCDTGERYLSKFYSDEWMRENQLLDGDRTTLAQVVGSKPSTAQAIVSVAPGASVRQALRLMSLHDVSQLPVMDGANCVGSVSEWSLSGKALENSKVLESTVSDVMGPPFPVVHASQAVDAVAALLSKANPAVLVQANGTPAGIVTRSDMLSYLMGR
ncbi:MAG: CBS domain-containing protein [Gemmatimonadaceae bacterium]